MQSISPTILVLLVISCLAIGLAIIALLAIKTLNRKFVQSLEIINGLHKHVQQKDEQLLQLDERLSGLELQNRAQASKLSNYEQQLNISLERLEQKVHDVQMEDPTTKRYHKASELLENGASIEEVMEICEIPRAEVDILLGLLRKK
ncbi:DUF2802 domain-containing protein [Glaciecola sp. KUL10]|uniref:DUF2802 domain-containing protein n=1 Tax=Glaciecola sp. (strain KUL10) TaxID=2161813 RepID=UPI000D789F78|nr:DUF2802 domain-containing protein [Glaciecola sp. KUL10]GBL04022.1 hypothetical protein KUL10_13270 [Glaciecola sp. KUL10]